MLEHPFIGVECEVSVCWNIHSLGLRGECVLEHPFIGVECEVSVCWNIHSLGLNAR